MIFRGCSYTLIRSSPHFPKFVAMEVIHSIVRSMAAIIEDGQIVNKLSQTLAFRLYG